MTGGAAGEPRAVDAEALAGGEPLDVTADPASHAPTIRAETSRATAVDALIGSMAIIPCPMTPRPIFAFRHPLRDVRVRVPASKSVANRALVLSAIAAGRSRLDMGRPDPGPDVRAMRPAPACPGYQLAWARPSPVSRGGAATLPPR